MMPARLPIPMQDQQEQVICLHLDRRWRAGQLLPSAIGIRQDYPLRVFDDPISKFTVEFRECVFGRSDDDGDVLRTVTVEVADDEGIAAARVYHHRILTYARDRLLHFGEPGRRWASGLRQLCGRGRLRRSRGGLRRSRRDRGYICSGRLFRAGTGKRADAGHDDKEKEATITAASA